MSFVQLDNLNDFIKPGSTCIKPPVENVGRVTRIKDISLSDCLACSGCITSAEKVLVDQQHSDQLLKILRENNKSENKKLIIASLSLQAIASLGHKNDLSPQETAERLSTFLKAIGVDLVFDINLARHLSLVEAHREYEERRISDKKPPLISSVCPGWICYVEKLHGELVIPHLSRVRSPQQIIGALIKNYFRKTRWDKYQDIFHFTVMPCFDKKLEASRDNFKNSLTESCDVDLVLTPIEIDAMLSEEGVGLSEMDRTPLDVLVETETELDDPLTSHLGSESGGYAENIMINEIHKLYPEKSYQDIAQEINRTKVRNDDFLDLSFGQDNTTRENIKQKIGRFGIVNGFRNLQTVIQRLKRKALLYDYIEVMACPAGCINGGAQCRPSTLKTNQETVNALRKRYQDVKQVNVPINHDSDIVSGLYDRLNLNNEFFIKELLHTEYKPIEKKESLSVNW